jgi:hypothetical protein
MLIQRDTNNWSFSTEEQNGLWHLIYGNDKNIIMLFESIGITSTQENLFVGTKEECDQYIIDNELIYSALEEQVIDSFVEPGIPETIEEI